MWPARPIRRRADTERTGAISGLVRREVCVISGLGVLLVGGVLGVGTVFAPGSDVPVSDAHAGEGSTLVLPGDPAPRARAANAADRARAAAAVTRTIPTDLVASAAPAG
ncbi:hypothetical protein ACVU7I_14210, partial [Patulibacter sp. S7RM1-6]